MPALNQSEVKDAYRLLLKFKGELLLFNGRKVVLFNSNREKVSVLGSGVFTDEWVYLTYGLFKDPQ